MSNEMAIISSVSDVCNIVKSVCTSIRQFGIIRKVELEQLRIKIERARVMCENEEAAKLFEHNLDLIERATNYCDSKHFVGPAKDTAEKQLATFAKRLEDNLKNFCRH